MKLGIFQHVFRNILRNLVNQDTIHLQQYTLVALYTLNILTYQTVSIIARVSMSPAL